MYQNKTEELLRKKQAENGLRNTQRKQSGILLYVRTWAGEVVTLNLGDSLHHATVGEVKHRIFNESQIKIPVEDQLLLFQGKEMDDDRTVISYGWLVFILCVHLIRRNDTEIPSLSSSLNLEELRQIAEKEAADFVEECKKNGNEALLIQNGFYHPKSYSSASSSADASTVASSNAVSRSATKTRRFSDTECSAFNASNASKIKSNIGGVLKTDKLAKEEKLDSSHGTDSSNLTAETILRSEIFSNGDQFNVATRNSQESVNANDYLNKNDRTLSKISEEDRKSATNTNSSRNTSRRGSRQNSYMKKGSKEVVIVSASDIMSKVNSLSRDGSVYSPSEAVEGSEEENFMRNFRTAYDAAWKNAHEEGVHNEMSPIWEHAEPNAEPSPVNNENSNNCDVPSPPSNLPSDFCDANSEGFLRTVSKRLQAEFADATGDEVTVVQDLDFL